MLLSDNATPEELIAYTEELAWGNYGEPVDICYSHDTVFGHEKGAGNSNLVERKVCGYVVYLLWVWLSNFPGCSEKDSYRPKKITPKTIQEFKKRITYLLPKFEIVSEEKDSAVAA